jgi:hypothetical protein
MNKAATLFDFCRDFYKIKRFLEKTVSYLEKDLQNPHRAKLLSNILIMKAYEDTYIEVGPFVDYLIRLLEVERRESILLNVCSILKNLKCTFLRILLMLSFVRDSKRSPFWKLQIYLFAFYTCNSP